VVVAEPAGSILDLPPTKPTKDDGGDGGERLN
jgi:hypothetical protein